MDPIKDATTALNRLLEPLSQSLGVEGAQQLLDFRIDPAVQARIDELADRSNEGLLTEAERNEYVGYIEGISLINLLMATARGMLSSKRAS
jgi:hypothetical protein